MTKWITALLSLPALLGCQWLGGEKAQLLGTWSCGPYSMSGPGFEVTVRSVRAYAHAREFSEESRVHVVTSDGKSVRTRDRSRGTWSFDGDVIETRIAQVVFLESDDPNYPVEMGQEDLDSQLRLKNWSKVRVLELGDGLLVTMPVESMYKGAEVRVTCLKQHDLPPQGVK